MSKETKKETESNYVTTVRSDAVPGIGANIYRSYRPDGHADLYFEIKRAWKNKKQKEDPKKKHEFSYSARMYPGHAEAIAEVAEKAEQWIAEHPEAAHMEGRYGEPSAAVIAASGGLQ